MDTERKCDIFISYRRDGGDMTAMYIYQALKERNYDVFYDLEVLRAGRFNDHLLEYISSCTDFILVLSPHALDRCSEEGDWVRKEIAEALRLKKNIIPIMLKGFTFPKELPEDIDDVRYQNGLSATTEYFQESMNRLCSKYLKTQPKKKISPAVGIAGGVAAGTVVAALALFIGKDALFGKKPVSDPVIPALAVTIEVTLEPTATPTIEPTIAPTATPTIEPTVAPTATPTIEPTATPVPVTPEPAKIEPVCNTDWPVMRSDHPWELFGGKYTEYSEDWIYGNGGVSDMPVFQNEAVLRKEVGSVTFLNTLANAGENAWDISQAQDGSVLAWTEKNGELYDLYIAGEGGVRAPEDCPGLFMLYRNVRSIELNGCLDTSENENFNSFFEGCTSLKTLDLRTMDTSNAANLNHLVTGCENLTALDVSMLDTSRATEMEYMFTGLNSIKSLDVSSFNTARARSMAGMFSENEKLQKLTLGAGFDTSRVRSMNGMFHADGALRELDVSGFRTANVEDMDWMFWGCEKLLELDVSGFDTSKVQTMEGMFSYCAMLDGLDVSGWNTDAVQNMRNIFVGCDSLQDIGIQDGKLYNELNKAKNQRFSRRDMFEDAHTEHTVRVIWEENAAPVVCAFAYDESAGHSYVFVNCPATAQKANTYWGDGRHLIAINSEAELEFLQNWAQRDGLNFHETWTMGMCDQLRVYGEHDDLTNLKTVWKESCDDFLQGWGRSGEAFFVWEDGQPDKSGHFLQLWQHEENGQIKLTMDDLNDDLRRPFIMEFDRKLNDGEEINLSWWATGGNKDEGYGEEYGFNDGSRARLGVDGVMVVSGTGETGLTHECWYNLYIREVIVCEGMKEIGFHTFDGCRNLSCVTLPESLKAIGEMAFADTNLSTITIPSGVEKIDENAFLGMEEHLTICAEAGSYAETFAKSRGIRFEAK